MLFVPLKLAPRERRDLKFFDRTKLDSIWVECRNDFSKSCKKTLQENLQYIYLFLIYKSALTFCFRHLI